MQPLTQDATTALLRAMRAKFAGSGEVTFEEIISRNWASITFTGARHEILLRIDGPGSEAAADAFLGDLEAAEFRLRGHILADIALISEERLPAPGGLPRVTLKLEALTVEDG